MYKINMEEFASFCFQSFDDAFSFLSENIINPTFELIYFQ